MFKLVNSGRRVARQVFDSVLVTQPVGSLDGIIHVPAPVIFTHVAERSGDAALCGNRVGARRENLADAGRAQARLSRTKSGAKAGATCADDNDVICVINECVLSHRGFSHSRHQAPAPIQSFSTESATVANSAIHAKLFRISSAERVPVLAI